MKEITIRLYDPTEINHYDAQGRRNGKDHFFEVIVDGEIYSSLNRFKLDIANPDTNKSGHFNWSDWAISMQMEKELNW